MKRLLALVALFVAAPALSATYYVDCAASNDRGVGTSPQTAWQTIDKVNRSTFKPGDSILFKRGCTWREQLGVIWSGFAGAPITFGAYGSGANPVFSGANLVGGWARAGNPKIWEATVTTEPKILFFDGAKGTRVASQANCTRERDWYWASDVLSVYSDSDPDMGYTSPGIEAGYLDQVIWIGDTISYVTLDGLSLTYTNGSGVTSYGTHITIQKCEASWNAFSGIVQATYSGDNVISDCTIHDNGGSGIFTWKDAASAGHENRITRNEIYNNSGQFGINVTSNWYIIEYNSVHDNGNSFEECVGIEIVNYDNDGYGRHNIVRYNEVYGQKGNACAVGINVDDFAQYTDVYGNVVHGCSGGGIGMWRSNHANIYNNTVYGNNQDFYGLVTTKSEMGVDAFGPGEVSNIVIRNNVVQATEANTYAIYLGPNAYSSSGLSIGNNNWYAAAANWYFWNKTGGKNLATWNALTGGGTDLNSDPLFAAAVGGDFALQAGSPCIDAGADVGSSYSTALMPGSSWPNKVLTGDQRDTGLWWEIGAYLFQERGPAISPPAPTVRKHLPRR
jgi:parallel beta-helix repeat protein